MNIAVLGAGAWGIALANLCASAGHDVHLWEFDPDIAARLQKTRKNDPVLPGIAIAPHIRISSDLQKCADNTEMVLLVVPSHVARRVLSSLAQIDNNRAILVSCTKGIEIESHMRISEIVKEEDERFTGHRFAVLSGPSHAEEVSRGIPTAVVVASESERTAELIQQNLTSTTFRLYRSRDVVGVELGGSLKNVIAIAAGICDGAGFGDNTKAALQPRGLAEIARLGRAFHANPLTFAGLSGMGDLIVTCMSRHSRNRYVGEQIGKGRKLADILSEMVMVAEGVRTCQAAVVLAGKQKVEMPICQEVYNVLFAGKHPKEAMKDLMNREIKPEVWY